MVSKILIPSAIVLKIIFTILFGLSFDYQNSTAHIEFLSSKPINNDESRYASVAFHYNEGNGFSYCQREKYFVYGNNLPEIRLTAYTPAFPVYIHIGYQLLWNQIYQLNHDDIQNYNSHYYRFYKYLIIFLSLLVFIFSVRPFRLIARDFLPNSSWETVAVLLYILAPALLVYVGLWIVYENMVTCMLVILVYQLSCFHSINKFSFIKTLLLSLLFLVPALLRPHILISVLLVVGFLGLSVLHQNNWKLNFNTPALKTFGLIISVFILIHGLIIYKNYNTIGLPVLSTQQANAFFLGHQPFTRGSWNGDSETKGSDVYNWRLQHIPNLESISDEAIMYAKHKELAWNWIKSNPSQLIWLESRKIVMFFLPYNFMNLKINIFNLIFNMGFLGCVGLCTFNVFKGKRIPMPVIYSLLIVSGALFLTIYSFYNLRFISYATPFLIICAAYFYHDVFKKIIVVKNK